MDNEQRCVWKYDDIDNYHETACGEAHCFGDGGVTENKHKFCPYCGKLIQEATTWHAK